MTYSPRWVFEELGASLLTKIDIKELLNVPEPLTQNQNVNELNWIFKQNLSHQ